MIQTRLVTSTLLDPDGNPIEDVEVTATLRDWGVIEEFTVAPGPIKTTTAADGSFSLDLWANESGSALGYDLSIKERYKPKNSKTFKISVPAGTDPIDLSLLNASSTIGTDESAIAIIQAYTDAQRIWGNIGGTITNQADLIAAIAGGGDPSQFFQTLLLFSELDTQAKRTTARENLELNYIDGGSF